MAEVEGHSPPAQPATVTTPSSPVRFNPFMRDIEPDTQHPLAGGVPGAGGVSDAAGGVSEAAGVDAELAQEAGEEEETSSAHLAAFGNKSREEVIAELFPGGLTAASDEVIDNLSVGVLTNFLPEMQKAKCTLDELIDNQRVLIETIEQENSKFGECVAMTEVTEVMEKAKVYHTKLINIKKDMLVLHEKSAKLKKRALKLQQQKQKEALQKEQEREKELERERQLTAKPVKRTSFSKVT